MLFWPGAENCQTVQREGWDGAERHLKDISAFHDKYQYTATAEGKEFYLQMKKDLLSTYLPEVGPPNHLLPVDVANDDDLAEVK